MNPSLTIAIAVAIAFIVVVGVVLALAPGLARALGERISDALFAYQIRTGAVLQMAEQTSREAARLATVGNKIRAASSGPVRVSRISGPATVAWAQNDTCGNRDRIPAGSRILGAIIRSGDMGTSITLDVGLRAWTPDGTGTAVDADGIVAAADVATAAVNGSLLATGALVAAGAEYVTSVDTEPYFTLAGGNPTDDTLIAVDVLYVCA